MEEVLIVVKEIEKGQVEWRLLMFSSKIREGVGATALFMFII